jgi:hypothetical protein
MANQASGRAIATQNTGLYNYYKNRSYKATVTSLGNALIQPTMYFNLRHVPMFEGSYMITDVSHSIQPGSFQTTFDGVRQGFFDLPTIDSLLQSINQNLVTKLEEILKINKDQVKTSATTNNIKSTEVVQSADNTLDTTNSCSSKITAGVYTNANPGYVAEVGTLTKVTPTDFAAALKRLLPDEPDLRTVIYSISYIRTFQENSNSKEGTFNGWNNNLGTLSLSVDWQGQVQLFPRVYSCVNIRTNPSTSSSQPIIHFESLDKYISFMAGKLRARVNQILEPNMGLAKYYVCHWPVDNISEQYFDNNINEFNQTIETFKKALASAKSVDLLDVDKLLEYKKTMDDGKNNNNTPEVTPTPVTGQTCPPAIITSFSPTIGKLNTIVQINGANFETTKEIKIGTTIVPFSGVTILNSSTIRFTVPQVGEGVKVQEKISITTDYGTTTSVNNFTYDPTMVAIPTSAQPTTAQGPSASIPPENVPGIPNGNNQSQETGPPVLTGRTTTNILGSDTSLRVNVNPEAGPWKIVPQYTKWDWTAVGIEAGPNNTFVETKIQNRVDSTQLQVYVNPDGKSFFVTESAIIDIVSKDLNEPDNIKKITKIYNKVILLSNNDDAFAKYNQTQNPDDIIKQDFEDFNFTVILK